jgi:hypothetical protein
MGAMMGVDTENTGGEDAKTRNDSGAVEDDTGAVADGSDGQACESCGARQGVWEGIIMALLAAKGRDVGSSEGSRRFGQN